jgi:transposase
MIQWFTTAIWVYTKPIDFRKQTVGLMMLVSDVMKKDPVKDGVYVFRNKKADRVKLLWWDGTGFWMCYKILETGKLMFPTDESGILKITQEQCQWLLTGRTYLQVKLDKKTPKLFY